VRERVEQLEGVDLAEPLLDGLPPGSRLQRPATTSRLAQSLVDGCSLDLLQDFLHVFTT
jgi:hypothetical protein